VGSKNKAELMQKHKRNPTSSIKTTQVDPKGLAKLYLRTPEIPDFFSAQRAYYLTLKTQHAQNRKRWLLSLSIVGVIVAFLLFNEFGFGDDEGVIVIFWVIGLLITLAVTAGVFGRKLNKVKLQEAKGQMLDAFFTSISEDLHPESGLKGMIDHGLRQSKDIYKRKTSPYSGSKKIYYKFAWANLKFMLVDGTTLRLRCIDKLKEKGGTVVRFEEIGKARMAPNTVIYDLLPGQHFNLRKNLCASEKDLIQHAPTHGFSLAKLLKENYRSKLHRRKTPLSPAASPQSSSAFSPNMNNDLGTVQRLLDQSELSFKTERLGEKILELRYSRKNTEHLLWLDVKTHEKEKRLGIRMPLLGEAPEALRLLKANPALAHGRFAYILQKNAGTRQLCLFSVLDLKTLTRETLVDSLQGLCEMGSHLASHDLPDKTRAYRSVREPDWERTLLNNAVRDLSLVSEPEFSENKAKVRLKLPQGRQQSVHIRFDRQDTEGNQLISLLSYCGADNPELYTLALEENSHYSYGAMGLDTLGEAQMFVVCENQLADTAEASLLQQALLQVAQKADQMEALLTSADVH
jgi:hypothetical protein